MRKGEVFVLSLVMASLIGILLSGVALAGNCCIPANWHTDECHCYQADNKTHCEDAWPPDGIGMQGIWLGEGRCTSGDGLCENTYCTRKGYCVPEMSTLALLATGLICMLGYFRLRREEG